MMKIRTHKLSLVILLISLVTNSLGGSLDQKEDRLAKIVKEHEGRKLMIQPFNNLYRHDTQVTASNVRGHTTMSGHGGAISGHNPSANSGHMPVPMPVIVPVSVPASSHRNSAPHGPAHPPTACNSSKKSSKGMGSYGKGGKGKGGSKGMYSKKGKGGKGKGGSCKGAKRMGKGKGGKGASVHSPTTGGKGKGGKGSRHYRTSHYVPPSHGRAQYNEEDADDINVVHHSNYRNGGDPGPVTAAGVNEEDTDADVHGSHYGEENAESPEIPKHEHHYDDSGSHGSHYGEENAESPEIPKHEHHYHPIADDADDVATAAATHGSHFGENDAESPEIPKHEHHYDDSGSHGSHYGEENAESPKIPKHEHHYDDSGSHGSHYGEKNAESPEIPEHEHHYHPIADDADGGDQK